MKQAAFDLNKYKVRQKTKSSRCGTPWQEFAKLTVAEFEIVKPYDFKVWKMAKKNLQFLKAQVTTLKEKSEKEGKELKEYNKLLTYLLK